MENCFRCGQDSERVKLFDAIYEGKMITVCERCSIIDDIPIIKTPSSRQVNESLKAPGVYERMKRLSGIRDEKKEEIILRKERLKELERNPSLELPDGKRLALIDHYYWLLMTTRRRKGLSQRQLAESIGEPESAIEMLEKGKIPENADRVVAKLEQFFQLKLRKVNEIEELLKRKEKKPVLLDEEGRILNKIPESVVKYDVEISSDEKAPLLEGQEIVTCKVENQGGAIDNREQRPKEGFFTKFIGKFLTKEDEEALVEEKNNESITQEQKANYDKIDEMVRDKDFDVTKTDWNQIKIADLREMHKRRVEATRQEKIEEQKKIEERQKLIEARKEELRQKKEKESKELDDMMGGKELLNRE